MGFPIRRKSKKIGNFEKYDIFREEAKKLQEDLDNEFVKKYEIEEEKLDQEIEDFLKNKGSFDAEVADDMPPEWTRFKFDLNIPETRFSLLDKTSTPNKPVKLIELAIRR